MKHWKRQALNAQWMLERAEYHFDVEWTFDDGSTGSANDLAVVNGTLRIAMPDDRRCVHVDVLVHKVVNGLLP